MCLISKSLRCDNEDFFLQQLRHFVYNRIGKYFSVMFAHSRIAMPQSLRHRNNRNTIVYKIRSVSMSGHMRS